MAVYAVAAGVCGAVSTAGFSRKRRAELFVECAVLGVCAVMHVLML